jgi:hypothetical protein
MRMAAGATAGEATGATQGRTCRRATCWVQIGTGVKTKAGLAVVEVAKSFLVCKTGLQHAVFLVLIQVHER